MGKDILTVVDIEIEALQKPYFLENVNIKNVLVSNKIFSNKNKTINTLSVTCMMIIKLNYYISCFQKRAYM